MPMFPKNIKTLFTVKKRKDDKNKPSTKGYVTRNKWIQNDIIKFNSAIISNERNKLSIKIIFTKKFSKEIL